MLRKLLADRSMHTTTFRVHLHIRLPIVQNHDAETCRVFATLWVKVAIVLKGVRLCLAATTEQPYEKAVRIPQYSIQLLEPRGLYLRELATIRSTDQIRWFQISMASLTQYVNLWTEDYNRYIIQAAKQHWKGDLLI